MLIGCPKMNIERKLRESSGPESRIVLKDVVQISMPPQEIALENCQALDLQVLSFHRTIQDHCWSIRGVLPIRHISPKGQNKFVTFRYHFTDSTLIVECEAEIKISVQLNDEMSERLRQQKRTWMVIFEIVSQSKISKAKERVNNAFSRVTQKRRLNLMNYKLLLHYIFFR